MFFAVFFQLVSFYLLCFSSAILTSALSCVIRPRLLTWNRIQGIKTFMKHFGIPESIRDRVLEHCLLEGKLHRGVLLPPSTFHFMFDSPNYLQDDALLTEFFDHFDGVPLLTKLDSKLVVKVAKRIRRILIPPNIVFLRKGEVRRKMYIVVKGAVGLFNDDLEMPHLTLTPSCHFGIRDLMLGEPAHYFVKSLCYTILLVVEYDQLLFIMAREPLLESLLYATKVACGDHIDNMADQLAQNKVQLKEKVPSRPSWINVPTKEKEMRELSLVEFNRIYDSAKLGRVMRCLLLDRVVNPNGYFALIWTGIISMTSMLTILALLTESFMQVRGIDFRIFQCVLDLFSCVDIYIRFHWGFYTQQGFLVTHPLQTALHYLLDGTFLFDVAFCFPTELVMVLIGVTNYHGTTGGIHWFSKLRWTRFGQFVRIQPIFKITHEIFTARTTLLLLMYATVTLVICAALASFAAYIACPVGLSRWDEGDEDRYNFCDTDSWAAKKDMIAIQGYGNRWIVGIYYVSQVILLTGYGDMITLKQSELLLLIFMMLFGSIIIVCSLADVTAATVDLENIRFGYLENIKRMEILMRRERVHPSLQKTVMNHLTHTWDKSRGLQPKDLFSGVHAALRNDLYETFVGILLRRVPLFKGLNDNIIKRIGPSLQKYYFVKGARLSRADNMEADMYIIVDGKVWITDHNRRWCYTLKAGESFGEVNMVFGTKRKFHAFAGSSLEVFTMSRADYIRILLRYPIFGQDLKRKLKRNGNRDLYTKLRAKIRREPYEEEEIEFKTNEINRVLSVRNDYDATFEQPLRKAWFRREIFDYGSNDTQLPFFYFVAPSNFKLIIHPRCPFFLCFLDIAAIVCCLSACLGILEVAFGDLHENDGDSFSQLHVVFFARLTFDLIMYFRIFLAFITPFENVDQTYCQRHKLIAIRYATTILGFPLDVIASFPVHDLIRNDNWTKWLLLIRLLRLIPFYRSILKKGDDIHRSNLRQKVTTSVVSFLLVAHFLACIFYAISACVCEEEAYNLLNNCSAVANMCPDETWTHAYVLDQHFNDVGNSRGLVTQTWRWYLRSLYWVVTTISTTGLGNITPHSIPEFTIGIICIFSGSFLLSVILSHFTSGISSSNQSFNEYFFQVNVLNTYYKTIGVSKDKERHVYTYFVYYWDFMRGVPYHITTANLPPTMKHDLCYTLYGAVLEDCRLFASCSRDTSFMRQLCSIVHHGYYAPGTNIVTVGDAALFLYIVYRGNVLSWVFENERFVIDGAFIVSEPFGKHGVLIYDQFYGRNYRAETHVEVLSIRQEDLLTLCRDYPTFGVWLESHTLKSFDIKDGQETIFDYQRRRNFTNQANKFSQEFIEAQQEIERQLLPIS